jgi:hypothetical protein
MDEAEQWLAENDPEYDQKRHGRKHTEGEEHFRPREETRPPAALLLRLIRW